MDENESAQAEVVKESLLKRMGRFAISHDSIKSGVDGLLEIFGKVIVLRAESIYHTQAIEYIAISPLFDVVEPELDPPSYKFIVTDAEIDGEIVREVKAERI